MSANNAATLFPILGLPSPPPPASFPRGCTGGDNILSSCLAVNTVPGNTMHTEGPCVSARAGWRRLCCSYSCCVVRFG